MNIEYIKTAFSADCSKNFDGKNMVQIMGKICPIYVPYFAHGVFTLNFNSHSHTGSDTRCDVMLYEIISIHTPIQE